MDKSKTVLTDDTLGSVDNTSLGIKFGYPQCCIDALSESTRNPNHEYWDSLFDGTGYTPCSKCLSLPPHYVLTGINERRSSDLPPFPFESTSEIARLLHLPLGALDEDLLIKTALDNQVKILILMKERNRINMDYFSRVNRKRDEVDV